MKIALWLTTFAALLASLPLAWLGLQWLEIGQGLHPMLSGIGVIICLCLTGTGAVLIDTYEQD